MLQSCPSIFLVTTYLSLISVIQKLKRSIHLIETVLPKIDKSTLTRRSDGRDMTRDAPKSRCVRPWMTHLAIENVRQNSVKSGHSSIRVKYSTLDCCVYGCRVADRDPGGYNRPGQTERLHSLVARVHEQVRVPPRGEDLLFGFCDPLRPG